MTLDNPSRIATEGQRSCRPANRHVNVLVNVIICACNSGVTLLSLAQLLWFGSNEKGGGLAGEHRVRLGFIIMSMILSLILSCSGDVADVQLVVIVVFQRLVRKPFHLGFELLHLLLKV